MVLAPGYEDLQFEPPSAGSYQLPSMGEAADGLILTTSGNAGRLHDYLGDKATVLSFISVSYTHLTLPTILLV